MSDDKQNLSDKKSEISLDMTINGGKNFYRLKNSLAYTHYD